MRWPTCRFETYLSRQKPIIRLKSYGEPDRCRGGCANRLLMYFGAWYKHRYNAFPLVLIQRVTHRGDEFFVVERFHEECYRADGHGCGARRQIFTGSDDDHFSTR